MSLWFFSPNYYKTNQIQYFCEEKGHRLVSSDRVFCIKSFGTGTNDFSWYIFDYCDKNTDKQLDIPQFRSLDRLPLPFSPFQQEHV